MIIAVVGAALLCGLVNILGGGIWGTRIGLAIGVIGGLVATLGTVVSVIGGLIGGALTRQTHYTVRKQNVFDV